MAHTTISAQPVVGDPSLLRTVLRENAAFSLLSGGFLAVGGAALDNWVGVNQWILIALGLGLVGYSGVLWMGASNEDMIVATGQAAVVGDIAWVVAALVIVAATSWLTRSGEYALLAISVPVLVFAIGQAIGLRRLEN